jgi:hypothetical protein
MVAAITKRIVDFTKSRPGLLKMVQPLANRYLDLAGYRKLGLLYVFTDRGRGDTVELELECVC